jgi:hypothetical protein
MAGLRMMMKRRIGLILVLLSGGISVLWGCSLGWSIQGGPMDFQAVYYGARTLIAHQNPYIESDVEHVFEPDGRDHSKLTPKQHHLITLFVNTPATLLLVSPFAVLPLAAGQVLWMIFTAGSLILAAYLMWQLAAERAPILSACLIGFLLLNCQVVFGAGNTAAIVVGLTVVAVWCFLKNRYVPMGVVCMAIGLAMKPHDAGLVWLFFLLAGTVYRKRALQTALLTAVLIVPAILWINHVAPSWIHDWQTNMATISAPGALNDPRPGNVTSKISAGNVISLQAVFSVFNGDPRFYNLASYLVCGLFLVVWAIKTMRTRISDERAWLALAVIVPLTVLVTYHRVYDAKLLLLTVPACALLWSEGGPIAWAAAGLNGLAVFLNADVPLAILGIMTENLHLSTATLPGQILTVVLARPNQEILLATSIFYLWVYARRCADVGASETLDGATPKIDEGSLLKHGALHTASISA